MRDSLQLPRLVPPVLVVALLAASIACSGSNSVAPLKPPTEAQIEGTYVLVLGYGKPIPSPNNVNADTLFMYADHSFVEHTYRTYSSGGFLADSATAQGTFIINYKIPSSVPSVDAVVDFHVDSITKVGGYKRPPAGLGEVGTTTELHFHTASLTLTNYEGTDIESRFQRR